ncbi:MAG: hypothetical protein Q9P01_18140 [Anaerolineae bacterium]|nr:hypothetical protein [Anaerolineae bacterium]
MIALGLTEADWSAWYRLFSEQRFDYDAGSEILFEQSLLHVAEDELYVTVGDGTQTPRSGRKMEGSGWLRNMRTPAFHDWHSRRPTLVQWGVVDASRKWL